MSPLRIGTRGSPLALWQARAVEQAIRTAGGPSCELVVIKTTGDRLATRDLSTIGGKRLFVKEIEEALLNGSIDLAAHSAKDLPADLPPGLAIGAALPREDPRDAVVLPRGGAAGGALLATLSGTPRVGTGSVRRVAQLARAVPRARFLSIRGNVGTRLRKLDDGECDALVLAAAGLVRLGLGERVSARLTTDECLPAPGQGTVAIEARESDQAAAAVLACIDDGAAHVALAAERALVQALGGDCRVPIGALAVTDSGGLTLDAVVASVDGRQLLRRQASGSAEAAAALGADLAAQLLADGADEILAPHRSPW